MNYGIDQLKLRNAGCLLSTGSQLVAWPELAGERGSEHFDVPACRRRDRRHPGVGRCHDRNRRADKWRQRLSVEYSIGERSRQDPRWSCLHGPSHQSKLRIGADGEDQGRSALLSRCHMRAPVLPSSLPPELVFEPNLIYGPICARRLDSSDARSRPSRAEPLASPIEPRSHDKRFVPGIQSWYLHCAPQPRQLRLSRSGDYYFLNTALSIDHSVVTAGFPDPAIVTAAELPNAACNAAIAADPNQAFPNLGATFYLGGSSYIAVNSLGSLEIMPRAQGASYENYVISTHCVQQRGSQRPDATKLEARRGFPAPSQPRRSSRRLHRLRKPEATHHARVARRTYRPTRVR